VNERSPANQKLGVAVLDLADGSVQLTLDVDASFDNEVGAVHGGFATFLLDGAMGRAAVRSLNAGETCATVQLSTQFIAPLAGTLRATGRITKRGKRIGFLEGECVDADGRVVARAQGTWAYFPVRT
jgi:uncharacterized protein (TIGR00369 family)